MNIKFRSAGVPPASALVRLRYNLADMSQPDPASTSASEKRTYSRPTRNQPCPCGSGRRYKSCCGAAHRHQLNDAGWAEAQRLFDQADAAARAEDTDAAQSLCYQLMRLVPDDRDTLRLLYQIKKKREDKNAAEFVLRRLRDLYPGDEDVLIDLAEYQFEDGRYQRGEQNLDRALRAYPESLRGHKVKARLAQQKGDFGQAEKHLRHALNVEPESADLIADLGRVLNKIGMKEEAEQQFRIALALEPDHIPTLLAWAECEESRGNLQRAGELLQRVRALDPQTPLLPVAEAVLMYNRGDYKQAAEQLKLVERTQLNPAALSLYYFYRGRVLDRLKRYASAFDMYRRANAVCSHHMGMRYHSNEADETAVALREFFTRERLAQLPRAMPLVEDEPRPVFIIGFPRSGATVLEQMLSLHPDICAADEIYALPNLARIAPQVLETNAPYPYCLERLLEDPDKVQQLRGEYLNMVQTAGVLDPGARWFTDKLPLNEWHLGLIQLVFPDARIVHMLRHPFDAVLSTYCSDVRHGELCGYNLEHAARHYDLTMQLFEHYKPSLDLDYLAVRYENLVMDIEKTARQVLQFIGVPYEPRCLEFHKNKRLPRSQSYADVKRPLYRDSVFRYRHYSEQIHAVDKTLRPWVTKLKYDVI